MSLQIKAIAILLALVVLVGGFFGYGAWRESVGKKNGANRIQVAWDADKAKIQAVTDAAIAQATAQKDMALQANEVIANDYQTQLSAAVADADSLAERLRNAEARLAAHSDTAAKAGDQPGITETGPQASHGELTNAVARVFAECTENADQLDALIAEIRPQL